MKKHTEYLRRCIEIAEDAKKQGNMPFGALLVDGEGTIILEQGNIEVTDHVCTGHAETALMEKASRQYEKDFLWTCTLYTTVEPCVMCAGTMYWGNLGHVVYGMSEEKLLELTGSDDKNPTFSLPCRDVFKAGQKAIKVTGPFPELEEEIAKTHLGFWDKH